MKRTIIMHIGNKIQEILKENRYSVTWFAAQICCTRTHVYKIFKNDSIDTSLLMRISVVLNYNFFQYLSDEFISAQRGNDIIEI